jgi:hypothetical protein
MYVCTSSVQCQLVTYERLLLPPDYSRNMRSVQRFWPLVILLSLLQENRAKVRYEHQHTQTNTNEEERKLQQGGTEPEIDLNVDELCSCSSCSDNAMITRPTGDYTCSQRIMGLITNYRLSEDAACRRIAKTEFVEECGPICDPDVCDGRGAISEEEVTSKTYCSCDSCTSAVWNRMAKDASCGSRISFLMDFKGKPSAQACYEVAGVEFPNECGACNPQVCNEYDHSTGASTSNPTSLTVETNQGEALASTSVNENSPQQVQPQEGNVDDIPLTPEFPLYCFPDYSERVRFENVWGKYTVEIKEGNNCGPSDNRFSRNVVSVDDDEIKLQFKNVDGEWEASEVRVLLPQEEMPFHYGEYTFSVKSIQVIDSTNGAVVDTVLPVSLIIGLFTWDATEDYATHEVRISQF